MIILGVAFVLHLVYKAIGEEEEENSLSHHINWHLIARH
jgi:hypothetical protein